LDQPEKVGCSRHNNIEMARKQQWSVCMSSGGEMIQKMDTEWGEMAPRFDFWKREKLN